mmetsp:Transcript_8611/g.11654  ORF Transcript_8611/g.11654 Transcript_8611/m.11654 type:complete len:218 (-) Transcript_8611:1063-1716(-)
MVKTIVRVSIPHGRTFVHTASFPVSVLSTKSKNQTLIDTSLETTILNFIMSHAVPRPSSNKQVAVVKQTFPLHMHLAHFPFGASEVGAVNMLAFFTTAVFDAEVAFAFTDFGAIFLFASLASAVLDAEMRSALDKLEAVLDLTSLSSPVGNAHASPSLRELRTVQVLASPVRAGRSLAPVAETKLCSFICSFDAAVVLALAPAPVVRTVGRTRHCEA